MNNQEMNIWVDALPSLVLQPNNFEVHRYQGMPDNITSQRLECPFSSRPCTSNCALFGCKRHGKDGEHVFVCRAPGQPMPLGKPDNGFDIDVLLAFSTREGNYHEQQF